MEVYDSIPRDHNTQQGFKHVETKSWLWNAAKNARVVEWDLYTSPRSSWQISTWEKQYVAVTPKKIPNSVSGILITLIFLGFQLSYQFGVSALHSQVFLYVWQTNISLT